MLGHDTEALNFSLRAICTQTHVTTLIDTVQTYLGCMMVNQYVKKPIYTLPLQHTSYR